MIENLSILFYLPKEKINKKGESPIYCRITIQGERITFSTQRSLEPKKWDSARQNAISKCDEAKNINPHLTKLRNKIYQTLYKLESDGKVINAEVLKNILLGREVHSTKSLFKVFEEHNNKIKKLINSGYAHGTHERYVTCLKHLQDFVLHHYKRTDFMLTEVNHEFIAELDYYLRTERKCCNNTTVKYIKNFRKIIRIALASSWIEKDPFINFKSKLHKVDRGYLTKEELDLLNNKQFSIKRIEQVKDVFVFQCYTGLAYCDTFKLTGENIIKDDSGALWIKSKRTKTDTPINVPLLPVAIEILNKYKSSSENTDKLLPVLSNQKANAYLKEVGDLCGIEKRLSCHLARHTFATTVTLANGVSLETVSKMLGHTNLVTTKIYARMLDSRVLSEMQMLSSKLKAE